jgi:hypothetical protein
MKNLSRQEEHLRQNPRLRQEHHRLLQIHMVYVIEEGIKIIQKRASELIIL